MEEKSVTVSETADIYFKDNNITSKQWVNFCQEKFNLTNESLIYTVWYEVNKIGYSFRERK